MLKLNERHANVLFAKILREVTTLAMLTHSNIVCYKTAWIEPYIQGSSAPTSMKKTAYTHDCSCKYIGRTKIRCKYCKVKENPIEKVGDNFENVEEIIFSQTEPDRKKNSYLDGQGDGKFEPNSSSVRPAACSLHYSELQCQGSLNPTIP